MAALFSDNSQIISYKLLYYKLLSNKVPTEPAGGGAGAGGVDVNPISVLRHASRHTIELNKERNRETLEYLTAIGSRFDVKDEPRSGRLVTDKVDAISEKVEQDWHISSYNYFGSFNTAETLGGTFVEMSSQPHSLTRSHAVSGCVQPLSLFYSDASADGVEERSLVPRSRSHARLRRNVTMSHAFSCVPLAFDL
ncbi:hypothetical protein EVAR_81089_1 [Eumeta japonica]|uniref:Uncharacterized protein n=1 Tax=Eumeta variegata TaxID=151549 RepID=A0A4C1T8K4_EUMVA|nr:hypothetical protein EVAR_81089_1 [Eumeta japonica]